MQNKIQIYDSPDFGQIRVVELDGQPWWVLSDVCKCLGLSNPTIVAQKLDEDEKLKVDPKSNLGSRSNVPITVITESGLYAVILRSDKPNAREFRKWITSKVLPSIRKHGAYINDNVLRRMQEDSEYTAELIRNLTAERNMSNALIGTVARLAPKAYYHDIILQSPDAIPVTIIAKDYGMSGTAFNKLLYRLNVQFRRGGTWLLYAKYQDNGYTVTNTYTKNGMTTFVHTYWTQRGRFWLYKLLKSNGILPANERTAIGEQMSLYETGVFAVS